MTATPEQLHRSVSDFLHGVAPIARNQAANALRVRRQVHRRGGPAASGLQLAATPKADLTAARGTVETDRSIQSDLRQTVAGFVNRAFNLEIADIPVDTLNDLEALSAALISTRMEWNLVSSRLNNSCGPPEASRYFTSPSTSTS